MNHKRGKPKHQRAGCLRCKPQKDERVGDLDNAKRKQLQEAVARREAVFDAALDWDAEYAEEEDR